MHITVYFSWRKPAPIYVTCREADIFAFKMLGYVQEVHSSVHLAKMGHPDSDLIGLIELSQQGAIFFGNIEATNESGPAVFAAHKGEFVIVPSNEQLQPVVAVQEDGTMILSGAKAFWDIVAVAKHLLRNEILPLVFPGKKQLVLK